jgi:hypothetical protein
MVFTGLIAVADASLKLRKPRCAHGRTILLNRFELARFMELRMFTELGRFELTDLRK